MDGLLDAGQAGLRLDFFVCLLPSVKLFGPILLVWYPTLESHIMVCCISVALGKDLIMVCSKTPFESTFHLLIDPLPIYLLDTSLH